MYAGGSVVPPVAEVVVPVVRLSDFAYAEAGADVGHASLRVIGTPVLDHAWMATGVLLMAKQVDASTLWYQ